MPRAAPCFYFLTPRSPTTYHLGLHLERRGWIPTKDLHHADFSEQNLAFDEAAARCLEYKHLLANLLKEALPAAMPYTYSINDNNWQNVLTQLDQDFYDPQGAFFAPEKPLVWILKPSMLNNGQWIKIFTSKEEIARHFLSNNRMGGSHVLQQYVREPHLLRDQRKYSIRVFMVLSNQAGAYLYPEGYCNVAKHPFSLEDFKDLRPHLTNEHLRDGEANVIQIPFKRFDFYEAIYAQIKAILKPLVGILKQHYPEAFKGENSKKLAFFGMDFMVDINHRVWLLEANHGPCFPIDLHHPLQSYVYEGFWESVIEELVLPMLGMVREEEAVLKTRVFEQLL